MKGEKTTVLGSLGDYEIGAKWKWQLHFDTVSRIFLATSLILLVFLALGCTLFWLQLTKLSSKHEELNQISVELLQLQSKILSEFDEFKKLKEELDFNFNIIDESEEEILREKRNAKNKSSVQNKRKAKKGNQGLMKRDLNLIDKSFAKLNSSSNEKYAHLERSRSVHYYVTPSDGIIDRWVPQENSNQDIKLNPSNSTLFVPANGLYNVYAQLYYVNANRTNSFEIRATFPEQKELKHSEILAQCSSGTSHLGGEVSCFTSVIKVLKKGTQVFVQQHQKQRGIVTKVGQTFFGIYKLKDL